MSRFRPLLFQVFSAAWLAISLALLWLAGNTVLSILAHLRTRIDDSDSYSPVVLGVLITAATLAIIYAIMAFVNARLLFRYTISRTVSRIAKLFLLVFPLGSMLGLFTLFLIKDAENTVARRRRNP